MQDFYELDPDGDLVFILAHDNEDENGLAEHEIPLTGAELPEAPPLGPDIIQFLWPTSVNTLVAEAPITDVPADVQASTPIEALTEPSAENQSYDTLTDGSAGIEGSGQNKEVRFRVSSRHMILASPVFKVMLRQEFKEAIVLRSTGKLEVTLEDDCPAAFLILLNIIHGHVRLVPREIDLDMLTRVAIIVDKYDCLEVVEIFSDMWFSKLRKKLPGSFTKTLLPWLCITWVFERADEFMLMTQIAQRESTGNIEEELANGLPIPSSILDMIEGSRLKAVPNAIAVLQETLAKYQGNTTSCPRRDSLAFSCDAMVLGGLIKRMASIGFLPPPELPYKGLSFAGLAGQIRDMELPTLCDVRSRNNYGLPSCGIKPTIDASISSLEDQLCGLDLRDFHRGQRPSALTTGGGS